MRIIKALCIVTSNPATSFCLKEGTTKLRDTAEEDDEHIPASESGGADIVSLYIEQLRAMPPLSVEEEQIL